jgi:DNA-directed RNA polymerase subunit RPC12/RpoP
MQCPRCGGLMVVERFEDLCDLGQLYFYGSRCVICGEILDPMILRNRAALESRSFACSGCGLKD